jgi:hypothetical protein
MPQITGIYLLYSKYNINVFPGDYEEERGNIFKYDSD